MASVSTMILRSMRMIGEKARGATLDSNEAVECLAEFNTFLEACGLERLLCYQITQDSLALTASTNSYTIGANGVFAVARPVKIVDPCFARDASGFDTPVKIIGPDAYGKIVAKAAGYTVPTHLMYDGGFSATSTGTVYLYPSPSANVTLYINSWKQLPAVSTLSHNVSLPPGYQLMIESNFAIHLAAGLTPISAELMKIAKESRAAVKGVNVPDLTMRLDPLPMYGGGGNIFTGG